MRFLQERETHNSSDIVVNRYQLPNSHISGLSHQLFYRMYISRQRIVSRYIDNAILTKCRIIRKDEAGRNNLNGSCLAPTLVDSHVFQEIARTVGEVQILVRSDVDSIYAQRDFRSRLEDVT